MEDEEVIVPVEELEESDEDIIGDNTGEDIADIEVTPEIVEEYGEPTLEVPVAPVEHNLEESQREPYNTPVEEHNLEETNEISD